MQDLLGGQFNFIFATPISAGPHIKSGRIRAIAVTGPARTAFMPEVPTVAESGYAGYEAMNWYAFVALAKTPKETLARLHAELVKVLNAADVRAELAKHGMESIPGTPEELAKTIERELAVWGRVVREANI